MLLERDKLLGLLAGEAEAARAGRGRLVMLAGEAGAGKTSLVRAFCDRGEFAGGVLWGACDALFTPRPLGPLLDLADEVGGELEAAIRGDAGPHEIVAALLRAVRARPPAIVVLEDVHWMDEATLDVLWLLARKVEASGALVLATYRDDEVDRTHPLRIMLGEIATSSAVTRLTIEPLSRAAVARLCASADFDAEELYRQTAGNPFFVTEVSPPEAAQLAHDPDAVLARAARLSDEGRALLDAVAVAPARVELWLLDALVGDGTAPSRSAWRRGCSQRTSMPSSSGTSWRGWRSRPRSSPRRRLELHPDGAERACSAAARCARRRRLAHHAEACGDADAVLEYAPPAGRVRARPGRIARLPHSTDARCASPAGRRSRPGPSSWSYSSSCYPDRPLRRRDRGGGGSARVLPRSRGPAPPGDTLSLLSQLQMCPDGVVQAEPAGARRWLCSRVPAGSHAGDGVREPCGARDERRGRGRNAALGHAGSRACRALRCRRSASPCGQTASHDGVALHGPDRRGTLRTACGWRASAASRPVFCVAMPTSRGRLRAIARWRSPMTTSQPGSPIATSPDYDLWRLLLLGQRACLRLDQCRWDEAAESARLALSDPRSSRHPRILGMVVLGLIRARRGDPQVWQLLDEARDLARPVASRSGSSWSQRLEPKRPG